LNRDFNPVLYFYHLRHWMSQFNTGFGVLQVLLLALLCVYLVRLRGAAFVLFASGFAGTTLEIVLLLAFQVLCGSVYHQLGIIVTVFMAGLALGAALANRPAKSRSNGAKLAGLRCRAAQTSLLHSLTPTAQQSVPIVHSREDSITDNTDDTNGRVVSPRRPDASARRPHLESVKSVLSVVKFPWLRLCRAAPHLSLLAFAIAAYALLLAFLLPLLNRLGDTTSSLLFIKAAIALLTLILATLVGMQFPLANRLEYDGTVSGASRLYTADFIGAFLGALLASALLIPLIGVTGVCLLTAALNIATGAMPFPPKAAPPQLAA
jgi:hypothetical protein